MLNLPRTPFLSLPTLRRLHWLEQTGLKGTWENPYTKHLIVITDNNVVVLIL